MASIAPPVVALTTPPDGTVVTNGVSPAVLTLSANAYDPDGTHLAKFLSYFDNMETTVDRDLAKALAMTPLAGLIPGQRPAFAITAGDRGCGKSTLAECIGELYGGFIDVRLSERDEDRMVSRLLHDTNLTKRVVRVDNQKGLCSSPVLEYIISTKTLSGHRMYEGDAARPNTFTTIITGNGLRLSRDIADRCFIIRLRHPDLRPEWKEEVLAYVTNNRAKIIMDMVYELRKPAAPGKYKDRWTAWAHMVLGRASKRPDDIIRLNQDRRNEADEDVEESMLILEALDEAIKEWIRRCSGAPPEKWEYGVNFETTTNPKIIRVRTTELAIILTIAFNRRNRPLDPATAGKMVSMHVDAGRFSRLQKDDRKESRGFRITLDDYQVPDNFVEQTTVTDDKGNPV
jgi:hypothetical protein